MRRVLIAVIAALTLAPAAHAEPRFRDVGPVVAGPFTDGHRWAAWSPVRGKLTLFDTARGRAWTQPLPPRCELVGVGGGRLLLLCPPPGYQYDNLDRPVLVDLRTGAWWEPPGVDAAVTGESLRGFDVGWTGIGRRWLRYSVYAYHFIGTRYLDTATGRIASDPASTVRQPSLDAPGLIVRLCSPLRRPRNPDNVISLARDPLLTVDYERPWAVLPITSPTTGATVLWLAHCGRTAKRALCSGVCDADLSGGVVTWTTRRELSALVLATGRVLRWRGDFGAPVHTANRLFATHRRSNAPPRLLMARLPAVNK